MRPFAVTLAVCALFVPSAAEAATVSVDAVTGTTPDRSQQIAYVAAPGEVNRLTIAVSAPSFFGPPRATFTDPGATITAGAGCTAAPDGHSAVCAYVIDVAEPSLRADLGDADDTVTHVGRTTNALVALGGPGNDTLTGGGRDDQLDGGGGTDRLIGNDGSDVLTDGDTDADANADFFDGGDIEIDDGGGAFSDFNDTVVYSSRTRDLTVDLSSASAVGGAEGEGDRFVEVESVRGGSGDDDLRARPGSNDNSFSGGAGDDRIRGAAGDDTISGGTGDDVIDGRGNNRGYSKRDRLRGGPGRDRLRGGGGGGHTILAGGGGLDRYACRGRRTFLRPTQARELVPRPCARIDFPGLSVRPMATLVKGRTERQSVSCTSVDRLELTLRERGGRRRFLGRTKSNCVDATTVLRVRLTRRGARLARRPNGVLVTARIESLEAASLAWSYRLK